MRQNAVGFPRQVRHNGGMARNITLGQRGKALRLARGLTVEQVADKIKCSAAELEQLEAGEPTNVTIIFAWSRALGCTFFELALSHLESADQLEVVPPVPPVPSGTPAAGARELPARLPSEESLCLQRSQVDTALAVLSANAYRCMRMPDTQAQLARDLLSAAKAVVSGFEHEVELTGGALIGLATVALLLAASMGVVLDCEPKNTQVN